MLKETHGSRYCIHSGDTKMYHDLREFYWRGNMKRNVSSYVAKSLVCQQVKVEHMTLEGLY